MVMPSKPFQQVFYCDPKISFLSSDSQLTPSMCRGLFEADYFSFYLSFFVQSPVFERHFLNESRRGVHLDLPEPKITPPNTILGFEGKFWLPKYIWVFLEKNKIKSGGETLDILGDFRQIFKKWRSRNILLLPLMQAYAVLLNFKSTSEVSPRVIQIGRELRTPHCLSCGQFLLQPSVNGAILCCNLLPPKSSVTMRRW